MADNNEAVTRQLEPEPRDGSTCDDRGSELRALSDEASASLLRAGRLGRSSSGGLLGSRVPGGLDRRASPPTVHREEDPEKILARRFAAGESSRPTT